VLFSQDRGKYGVPAKPVLWGAFTVPNYTKAIRKGGFYLFLDRCYYEIMNLPPLSKRQFIFIYLAILLIPLFVATTIQEIDFRGDPPIGAYVPPFFGSTAAIFLALVGGGIIHLVLRILKVKDHWWVFIGYLCPAIIIVGLTILDTIN